MYASEDLNPRMSRMARAIRNGDTPFEGMVPAALDGVFSELSPSIGRSTKTLHDLYFLTLHGQFDRSNEEMDKIRLQLGSLQREVGARLRSDTIGPHQLYRPKAQELDVAMESALALMPGVELLERQLSEEEALFRVGSARGRSIEVLLHTRLTRPGTYTQDILQEPEGGRGLSCALRPLFGDFRDWSYRCADDVPRWTDDILRYAGAVFEWWDSPAREDK